MSSELPTERDINKLQSDLATLKRKLDQAGWEEEKTLKALEEKFGVKTLKEAKSLYAKLQAEWEEKETKLQKDYDAYVQESNSPKSEVE